MEGRDIEHLFWLSSALIIGVWVVFYAIRGIERFGRFVSAWQKFAIIATYILLVRVVLLQKSPHQSYKTQCLLGLKLTALGLETYEIDSEGLPRAEHWEENITPYVKSRLLFRTEEGSDYGYAFNANLSRLKTESVDPQTLMCAESNGNALNSLIRSKEDIGAHFGGQPIIGYADGHAKSVSANSSAPTFLKPGDKVGISFPKPTEPAFDIGKTIQSWSVRGWLFLISLIVGVTYYFWTKDEHGKPSELGAFVGNVVILSLLSAFLCSILFVTF